MELTVLVSRTNLFKEALTEIFDCLDVYAKQRLTDKEHAQKTLHAAILLAYDNAKPFMDNKQVLKNWITSVVKQYIDYERRMHPSYRIVSDKIISLCRTTEQDDEPALQLTFQKHLADMMQHIMDAMKKQHQLILHKHYVEGQSIQIIANEIGASVGEIKKQDHQAKLIFQEKLLTYITAMTPDGEYRRSFGNDRNKGQPAMVRGNQPS